MKFKKLEILSKDETIAINSASLQLLATTGIKVESPSAKKVFFEYGATEDNETGMVLLPEYLVKDRIKSIPKSFKLHGVNEKSSYEISIEKSQFATIGTPVKIYDPSKKSGVRKSVLEDTIKQIKIVDSLDNIINSHVDVWPNDVPYLSLHVHLIRTWAMHSIHKPYGLGCFGRLPSQDMMDITSMIVGGIDNLKKYPRLMGFFNTTSPLLLPQILTNGFEVFAKNMQPTIIAPEAMAGSTAPVTLAGLLVQTNAEVLAGALFSQLIRPGAPVLYGTVSNVADPHSGNSAMGSIETGLITSAMAQLARFYGIPSRGPGCVTDSKVFDLQNGFERMHTLLLAAQSGINYITCAGTYEATLAEALELLVIDDELAGMTSRMLEGIEVNEKTMAIDVIKNVATSQQKGKSFLNESHTIKNMRKALFIPKLADRERRGRWKKNGAKDIMAVARERVDKILEQHESRQLDKDLDEKLLKFIKQVETRTMEFYRKEEGLESQSVDLPAGTDEESL